LELVDWMGCGQHYAGAGRGSRLVVNLDLSRHGELRRRRGMSNRAVLSGSSAIAVNASGRIFLIGGSAGAIAALRVE
jgi:hypothetical protein